MLRYINLDVIVEIRVVPLFSSRSLPLVAWCPADTHLHFLRTDHQAKLQIDDVNLTHHCLELAENSLLAYVVGLIVEL